MLKTIDILLGITVVMLIASMAVTVLTQFVTGLLNTRGKHLLRGLGDLLQQIDPGLERQIADQIARAVLTHPMISSVQQRPGNTIHREELTKLLMDIAAGNAPHAISEHVKPGLQQLLANNGISDPADTLDKVRAYALQLELTSPELAGNVRHNIALIKEANSKFVAKINSCFDQIIDRVSDRFTATTRVITLVCSMVVVLAIQLDTLDVINRLSLDDGLRNTLVAKAFALDKRLLATESLNVSQVDGAEAKTSTEQTAIATANSLGDVKMNIKGLQDLGIINVPTSTEEWLKRWQQGNPAGMILTVFLLSLGAPFWYGALKSLLKLRGNSADKDDEQRYGRQTNRSAADQLPASSSSGKST
ncbi:MAG: hypothetical protein Q8N35_16495 [Methylococcaceae bacterium]|jgi:hypothetical protein|nr:hypothetical protein [Methylococcaceae bacterium]MDZ4157392.1 hypothetical protein [Methylococcales bacterium]MDP2392681.1 hypothetical protein [Methylococcaceae bacterium]MDP3021182.1 hypothetical protein [Methylococcaceae bacterium]MDP3390133.1 hypothetical protein [Methylococcaceae bacterium]